MEPRGGNEKTRKEVWPDFVWATPTLARPNNNIVIILSLGGRKIKEKPLEYTRTHTTREQRHTTESTHAERKMKKD